MQNIIVGYVERLHDRIAASGGTLSIGQAAAAQLRSLSPGALLRLRDAALDLQRIAELEIQRQCQDEDADGHIAAAERALGVQ